MLHFVPLTAVATMALVGLLAWAVSTDVQAHRIPNRLVLTGLLGGALFHGLAWMAGQPPLAGAQPWACVSGALVGGALLLPLYLMRACGAGDVKLMAMVGAFVGPDVALSAALYTLVAGGVLALVLMTLRGAVGQTLANVRWLLTDWGVRASAGQGLRLAPLAHTAARLPYAVAIAAGTGVALLHPLWMLA